MLYGYLDYYELVFDCSNTEMLKSIIKDRNAALYAFTVKNNDRFLFGIYPIYGNATFAAIREKGSNRKFYECDTFIDFGFRSKSQERRKLPERYKNPEGVIEYTMSYPDEEALLDFLKDKEIVYRDCHGRDFGRTELDLVDYFCEYMLAYYKASEEHILCDTYYDVKVFLSESGTEDKVSELTPIDIRNLDVNRKILDYIKHYIDDMAEDKDFDYSTEFSFDIDNTQAQYLTSIFHSNRNWDLDPICKQKFRISAYVLPGGTVDADIPENKVAHSDDGKKYKIDSIHFNTEIVSDLDELNRKLGSLYWEIAEA